VVYGAGKGVNVHQGGKEIQNSNGKGQMENHLKIALCHLPSDLLASLQEPVVCGRQ
jgi:hypothetical protein